MSKETVTIERKDKTTFEADPSYVETPEFLKLKRTHGLKVVEREPEAEPPVDTKEPEKESKSKPSNKDTDAK